MSADPKLVAAMFRLLATAQKGGLGFIEVEASTPEGIASVTLAAMPTPVWRQLRVYIAEFGETKDIGRMP